ncbi:hypothetical protein ACTXT7_011120, partial [Hymenolepis weldensis]
SKVVLVQTRFLLSSLPPWFLFVGSQRQAGDIEHEGIRSDTSVDAGQRSLDESKVSRKKRRFKMPSFARKSKDKKKGGAPSSKETPSQGDTSK